MATKKTRRKSGSKARPSKGAYAGGEAGARHFIPEELQLFLKRPVVAKPYVNAKPTSAAQLRGRLIDANIRPTVSPDELAATVDRLRISSAEPEAKRPTEVRSSVRALKPEARRFHGAKLSLTWFPFAAVTSLCADRFGYMSPSIVRAATKLPFNAANRALLEQLGGMMGDPGRDPNPASHNPADAGVSVVPAGFTYVGQFVDHDITFDISSSLDVETDANTINNMRSPALDLDALYSRGPGLDPFLYGISPIATFNVLWHRCS